MKIILSIEVRDLLIKEYIDGASLATLGKKYNFHTRVIKREIEKHVVLRTASQAHHKYIFDENIFDNINSNEKAYWLGFLMGDGCVVDNYISLSLKSTDIDHLEKFNKFAKSNYLIKTYKRICKFKNGKVSNIEYSKLTIASPQWVSSLAKYNVFPRKTFCEKFPDIEPEYYNSFILGFFDADGSWIIDNNANKCIHFKIIGNVEFLTRIQGILIKECMLKTTKIFPTNKDSEKPIYVLTYGGNQVAKRIAKYLYNNNDVFLDRKQKRVNHFFLI